MLTTKSVMQKRRHFKYKYAVIFIIGLLCGFFLSQTHIKINQKKIDKLADINRGIIAPYYDASVFQRHKVLTASHSATIKIPIIMYHYVEYVKDIGDIIRKRLDITPNEFEQTLITLKKNNYQTYFVKDIPDILKGDIQYDASQSAVLTFDDGYEDFYYDVYPLLKKYQMKATSYIITNNIGRKGFLNENEIREMLESDLVEIGSHTLNHVYLKTASFTVAKKQIEESKYKLEELFHINVKTFAYPYGAFNQDIEDLVKQASFSAAVSVIPGTYQSMDNRFHLYRIRPGMFTSSTVIKVLNSSKK